MPRAKRPMRKCANCAHGDRLPPINGERSVFLTCSEDANFAAATSQYDLLNYWHHTCPRWAGKSKETTHA